MCRSRHDQCQPATLRRRESRQYGLVVAEALACGTPVCGFDRGALSELLSEDVAVLVAPDDVSCRTRAVRRALAVASASTEQFTLLSSLERPVGYSGPWVQLPKDDSGVPTDPTAFGQLHWACPVSQRPQTFHQRVDEVESDGQWVIKSRLTRYS
jgi:hypothetical protein